MTDTARTKAAANGASAPAPLRVLLIGTMPLPVEKAAIGGGATMMTHLIDSLHGRDDLSLSIVDTAGIRGSGLRVLPKMLGVAWQVLRRCRGVDVVAMHVSYTALPTLVPMVFAITRLCRRPLVLRKFGGANYTEFGWFRRGLSRFLVRRVEQYLVETKELMAAAEGEAIPHIDWFPNTRPRRADAEIRPPAGKCRRFVYLSQIKVHKGIRELIAAAERFGDDVTVDVYGPFFDGLDATMFAGCRRVHYRGIVPPERVMDVLPQYDALVLPTYYDGEGYPGILLEAYNAGLPVVTTRWKAVPEIADETCALVVEPRDADGLYVAMKRLVDDDALYARLCAGLAAKRHELDSATWAEPFVTFCRAAIARYYGQEPGGVATRERASEQGGHA